MKNILKIFCLSLFMLNTFNVFAQEVDKATFDQAVDYVNCKIAELSMLDQPSQPHLADYQTAMSRCDVAQFNGEFYNRLKTFLSQKNLSKNQQLAVTINAFKVKYDSKLSAEDLWGLIMEDLMMQAPIEDFKGRHQTNYPPLETEMANNVNELFGVASRRVEFDENNVIEGETATFQDTNLVDAYIQQDGGVANNELFTNEEEDNPTMPDLGEKDSFFSKYRWYIFGMLLIAAFGYFWFTRGGNSRINNPIQSNNAAPKKNNSTLNSLQNQMDELENTSLSLQEEVTMLRYRIAEFEKRIHDNMSSIEPTLEIEDKASTFIEDINEDAIEQNVIDDSDDELITSSIPMTAGSAFFMPIPSLNGVFEMDEASNIFKRPYSVYIFTITSEDGKQAEFKIYEDIATMLRALDNFDEYVRPACRSTAILHKNATKIVTEENGLAIKDGNAWKVVTKAVIRYA